MGVKKGFLVNHAKSSAALVSLGIHAVLVVIAFSFVAVSVIRKSEVDFVAKPVSRPKMNLRRLQVPVNTKRPVQQPKLRKQIVVKQDVLKAAPDIKLPEIVGVKGGIGAGSGGLGGAVNIGFVMPDIDFFGVKRKSERIMLILDGGQYMASDQLGGAYGFEVIKQECLKLIEGLPPTAVFNIVVYGRTRALFPEMISASRENVQKAKDWLTPLNQVKGAKTRYGVDTLGSGGTTPQNQYPFGKFKEEIFSPRGWNEPVMLAMQQQADTVFLLTGAWGFFGYDLEDNAEMVKKWRESSNGKWWAEHVAEGRRKLDEENKQRMAAGEPPSALNRNSELDIIRHYWPGNDDKAAPHGERAYLGEQDLVKAFLEAYKAYAKAAPKLGIKKTTKAEFSLNVIFFQPEKPENDGARKSMEDDSARFAVVAKALNGEFRAVAGLKAIESYVK